MGRRRTSYETPVEVDQVLRYGPDPVGAGMVGTVDGNFGARLAGAVGHVPIGDPQTLKRTGALPPQQQFIGLAQLTNLVNAKMGLATVIPGTKPNPGLVPLTVMQQQLANLANL